MLLNRQTEWNDNNTERVTNHFLIAATATLVLFQASQPINVTNGISFSWHSHDNWSSTQHTTQDKCPDCNLSSSIGIGCSIFFFTHFWNLYSMLHQITWTDTKRRAKERENLSAIGSAKIYESIVNRKIEYHAIDCNHVT